MAGNRKLPFGYRMELGRVVVHSAEVDVVQYIFQQYILGSSYKELVDHLREQEVPYDHDKLWNKNMVARILENGKYIGQDGWPAIIAAEQFDRALEKRSSKVTPPQRTEAQKVLRRLGGGSSAAVEQTILCVLNLLAANPQQIAVPQSPPSNSSRIAELQSALDHELEQRPVNEDTVWRWNWPPRNTKESAIRSMKPNGFNGYFSGMPLWRTWMQDFSNPLSVKWRFTVKRSRSILKMDKSLKGV